MRWIKLVVLCVAHSTTSSVVSASDNQHVALPTLSKPLWSRPTILDRPGFDDELEVGKPAKAWIDRMRKQRRPLPGFVPVVVDGIVLYRSHADWRAAMLSKGPDADGNPWDAGDIIWQTVPLNLALVNLSMVAKHSLYAKVWLEHWLKAKASHLLLGNLCVGTCTTYGKRLYMIDDLALVPPPYKVPDDKTGKVIVGTLPDMSLENRLSAIDITTGKFAFFQGGNLASNDLFRHSHFLNPPLLIYRQLHLLNEKNDGTLRLVGLGLDGKVQLIQKIDKLPAADRYLVSPRRRLSPAVLTADKTTLVAVPHAGRIYGIDVDKQTIRWKRSYRPSKQSESQWPPSLEWRYPRAVMVGDRTIVAAADATTLQCLKTRTGDLLWKRDRGIDVYLAGAFGKRLVLVSKGFCRALDVSGTQVWKTKTGIPAGRGARKGDLFYLPLQGDHDEIVVLDATNGTIHGRVKAPQGARLGNLVIHQKVLLSQTATRITVYSLD